jgi:RNA polymerase sigma factor (sigma-70 family)
VYTDNPVARRQESDSRCGDEVTTDRVSPISARAERLFRQHWLDLVRHAQIVLLSDTSTAEDLAAHTIARFLGGDFDSRSVPEGRLLPFAKGVIRMDAKHVLRESGRIVHTGLTPPTIRSDSTRPQASLRRMIDEALTRLTPAEREVLELHYLQGWTIDQIACTRGSKRQTVKEISRRAKHKLRPWLDRSWSDGDFIPGRVGSLDMHA